MRFKYRPILCFCFFFLAVFFVFLNIDHITHAQSIDDLRKDIDSKNQEIRQLEGEAAKFREQLSATKNQSLTLKNELGRIEKNIKSLQSDIKVTQKKIDLANLEINALNDQISVKETKIDDMHHSLAGLLQAIAAADRQPFLAVFAGTHTISEFFSQVDFLDQLRGRVVSLVGNLKETRAQLAEQKNLTEQQRIALQNFRVTLNGSVQAQASVEKDKSKLLAESKNNEQKFQALIKEKEAKRDALKNEITGIEQKIKFILDPASLPTKQSGVLGWPLAVADGTLCQNGGGENCITQVFGDTAFARTGAYGGKGHNGVDFRASVGTPVLAAGDGVVIGVGDTDATCVGASYGKWILIKHDNGLTTVYGHLSAQMVSQGQPVKRGQTIAFSGESGYATGPHLHLSVFASDAVKVTTITSKVCGTQMTLPVSALNGYLDPMSYL